MDEAGEEERDGREEEEGRGGRRTWMVGRRRNVSSTRDQQKQSRSVQESHRSCRFDESFLLEARRGTRFEAKVRIKVVRKMKCKANGYQLENEKATTRSSLDVLPKILRLPHRNPKNPPHSRSER